LKPMTYDAFAPPLMPTYFSSLCLILIGEECENLSFSIALFKRPPIDCRNRLAVA